MNTPTAVRLALLLSLASAFFSALVALRVVGARRNERARTDPPSVPLEPSSGGEAGEEDGEDLRARMAALEVELRGLRAALQAGRREPVPGTSESGPAALLAAPSPPSGTPATGSFSVRDELLRNFAALSAGGRKDALSRLAEMARWGDAEARELLVGSLADPSASVRARAVRELGELGGLGLAENLGRAASDPSSSVREAVAEALEHLPRDDAAPLLVQLLDDPRKDVVLAAIRAADALDCAEARPRLQQRLAADDLDVAARAASVLRELGDGASMAAVLERVLAHLRRSDVAGRIEDVKRLRALRARAELQGLVDTDPSSSVRYEAQKALAQLED